MRRVRAGLSQARLSPSPPPSPPTKPTKARSTSLCPTRGWRPGDPILFANNIANKGTATSSPVKGREWKVGDPILFATEKEEEQVVWDRTGGAIQKTTTGGKGKEKEKKEKTQVSTESYKKFPSPAPIHSPTQPYHSHSISPSQSTTAATTYSPSHSILTSSSLDPWPLIHRFEPPSPTASFISSSSTARFSFSRSYAQIDMDLEGINWEEGAEGEMSADGEVEIGSFGAVDEWGG
ncbi:hypothetical protein P7C70_g8433, partial [Phenoliferia sp. Uapishka_3]